MVDDEAAGHSTAARLQRAFGELAIAFKRRNGQTALDGLRQGGCLKARFPRPAQPEWLDVVTLNTSGGVAGGDVLNSTFAIGTGARASIASQAAERFYRALPDSAPSCIRTRITVDPGGAAEWLPQETILFNRCAVQRHLRVDLAADAWFLGLESLVFGRAAMGETVECALLQDVLEIRRDGRLLWRDTIRLEGEVAALLRRPAVASGARAIATLVYVSPDAETVIEAVRAASTQCAASAWDGMLVARMLASDGASLRSAVIDVLRVLRGGRSLPRVWLC